MGFPGGSSGKQMQKWKLLSSVDSATLWTITRWVPLSIGFSRQEYWSGFPCPPPGDLPNPGIESRSPTLQEHSSPSEPPGKSQPANVGDIRDGSGRSPRGRQGNPLQDSCLENPMDRPWCVGVLFQQLIKRNQKRGTIRLLVNLAAGVLELSST